MAPAFNSASIAICFPGNASSVKRALTSAIRVAPFVITMNWMITKIRKTTTPTIKLPPTTKSPNVETIFPASPFNRIKRVVATFSDNRKRVNSSKREGNAATSNGRFAPNVTNSNMIELAILQARNMSNKNVGSGISNTTSVIKNAIASQSSLR